MARFQSMNPDAGVYLLDGGTGVIGDALSDRSPTPDPIIEKIDVSPTEIIFNIPQYNIVFRFGGNSFAYNGSGDVYGFSGTINQETLFEAGVARYTLSGIEISPVDYFMRSTWESVFFADDQIYLSDKSDDVKAGSGNDVIEAGRGFDRIWAGSGNDSVQGGFNGDQIYGEDGNDDLRGGNGLDLIVGGSGNDTIRGAKGTDTLTGGDGADVFVFERELDGKINIDTITDFVSGTDRIELSAAIFGNVGAVGSNVGLSQYIKYNAATGVLSYDADGSGAGAAVAFAVLGSDTHPATVGTDFWVVV
jgi:Ca2+-binding RTX toxin-like protein